MAKLKTKLVILAVVGVVLAVFYPKIKSAYGKHVKPHADVAGKTFRTIKDFSIFGYHVPWKYVLPGFALFLAVQLFRVSIISILLCLEAIPHLKRNLITDSVSLIKLLLLPFEFSFSWNQVS